MKLKRNEINNVDKQRDCGMHVTSKVKIRQKNNSNKKKGANFTHMVAAVDVYDHGVRFYDDERSFSLQLRRPQTRLCCNSKPRRVDASGLANST